MSGNEVPRATNVIPTNQGLIPTTVERLIAPWTRNWAPITDQRTPKISQLSPARTSTFRPKIQPVNSSPIVMSSTRSSISSAGPVRCEIARFRMYGTNRAINATPSYWVKLPSKRRVAATRLTIARKTASRRTISRDVLMGRTSALTPITNAIVTTVEARAFPNAMSGLPSSAAIPLTESSGNAERVDTNRAPNTNRLRPIRPESRVALTRAPRQRMSPVRTDLAHTKQWMAAGQSLDKVTPGPVQVRTAWKETRKAGKRTMKSTIQGALYRPPSQLGLQVDGKAMRGQMTFTLAPKEGGTEVRYDAQMWGKGLFRLMSGMMNRMMAEEDHDILDRLRGQVERGR